MAKTTKSLTPAQRLKQLKTQAKEQEARLKILDKQIAIKEDMKRNLDKAVTDGERSLDALKKDYDEQSAIFLRNLEQLQGALNKSTEKQERIEQNVTDKAAKLNELRDATVDAERYLKEQQEIVETTIAEWNAQLTGLQQEADTMQSGKQAILATTTRLEQEKQVREGEITVLDEKIVRLTQIYNRKLAEFQESLQLEQSRVSAKQVEIDQLNEQLQFRLDTVASREQAVAVAETALQRKELDLINREKNISMKINMLQLN